MQLPMTSQEVIENLRPLLLLGLGGFLLSLALTPLYTTTAYRYKWWKRQRQESISGEKASVFAKIHHEKHLRHIPTMAGIVGLVALVVTTLVFNLDRAQTYLPLAAMVCAGALGLLDDSIRILYSHMDDKYRHGNECGVKCFGVIERHGVACDR